MLITVTSFTLTRKGNDSANVKLLKLGHLESIQVASFRNVCEISQLYSADVRKVVKGDLLKDFQL
jgi:hypothetical protein